MVGIAYFIGRKIPAWLDSLGLQHVAGEGNTAYFNGRSDWATYWAETMQELAPSLLKSGHVTQELLDEFQARYQSPHYWTSVITASWGHKPRREKTRSHLSSTRYRQKGRPKPPFLILHGQETAISTAVTHAAWKTATP